MEPVIHITRAFNKENDVLYNKINKIILLYYVLKLCS
jgi:hypothetical protein